MVSLGCMQDTQAPPTAWHSAGPVLCRPQQGSHCSVAGWCQQYICPNVCFWSSYTGLEMFNNSGFHRVCHYVILSAEAGVLPCPCGSVGMDSLPSMRSLSCPLSFMLATYPVDYTALHNWLPVCFMSHMCSCTIYTAIHFSFTCLM